MVQFIATYTEGESGFWAPTHHERRVRLISTVGSAIPPAAAATLRDSFLSEFGFPSRLTPAARAALTATGLGHDERPVWSGYVHNVLSLVALALLVISLRWVPDAISGGRAARRARSLAQERCPRCGYSIRDLPEPKCPECGEALEWSPQTALRKATE
jgi:hypothetical protein